MIIKDSLLQETGIYQYGLIDTKEIIFSDEVRRLCEGNVCTMLHGLVRLLSVRLMNVRKKA